MAEEGRSHRGVVEQGPSASGTRRWGDSLCRKKGVDEAGGGWLIGGGGDRAAGGWDEIIGCLEFCLHVPVRNREAWKASPACEWLVKNDLL